MHFYSIGYTDLLALPIRVFWFMNSQIDRIAAQKDMRSLNVAVCSMGGEAATNHRERLILEIGSIVTAKNDPLSAANTARDEQGFAELRAMANEF